MRFGAIFLSFLIVPFALFAEGASSWTGFVEGPVWFSEESLKLDQTVKIYSAVFNGESSRMVLKVDFVDDTTVLNSKEIIVNPNETKTVFTDWKVSSGSHEIFAIISSAKVEGENFILERIKTDSVKFSVTKEVPGSVIKNALTSKFLGVFEGEGDFMEKADNWFKLNFAKSEEFREETLKKIDSSKDKIGQRREEKDLKSSQKFLYFLHFYTLVVVKFIFSVSVLFYIVSVVIIYLLLRLL